MEKATKISERYFEKPKRLKTWSGIPVKETYTPDDIEAIDYAKDIGAPGEFPFARGIHPTMYRGRMWSMREICGYDSPRRTNERLKYLMSEGETALNIIHDSPSGQCVDSDHPRAEGEVGLTGVPQCSVKDVEILMDGIPIDQVSLTMSPYWMPPFVQYLALAEKQGIPLSTVRGTVITDGMAWMFTRYHYPLQPVPMGVRMTTDWMAWCSQNAPLVYPCCVGAYAIRESGATAAQEIAVDFCIARHYLKESVKKGADIDHIARRLSFTHRCGIDIFEEAAKFRAARRVWAKMLRDELGAKDPRSLTYKVHVVTRGSDLIPQQAENNIIRIAYQALAAILGGVQSMHTTSFDEPICIPTEESARIAVRTQQILAYETGVVNVADPLGGSYYVEWLTKQLEEEIIDIMNDLKENIEEAVESGRLWDLMSRQSYQFQKEVESGERTLVGLNAFTIAEEEERPVKLHSVSQEDVEEHVENLRELKKTRDNHKVKETLEDLRKVTEKTDQNMIPAIMEASKAYATLGEITGVIRMGYGYDYDPFGELEYPF